MRFKEIQGAYILFLELIQQHSTHTQLSLSRLSKGSLSPNVVLKTRRSPPN